MSEAGGTTLIGDDIWRDRCDRLEARVAALEADLARLRQGELRDVAFRVVMQVLEAVREGLHWPFPVTSLQALRGAQVGEQAEGHVAGEAAVVAIAGQDGGQGGVDIGLGDRDVADGGQDQGLAGEAFEPEVAPVIVDQGALVGGER